MFWVLFHILELQKIKDALPSRDSQYQEAMLPQEDAQWAPGARGLPSLSWG